LSEAFGEAFAFVFDLVMLNGIDLRALPWRERRADLRGYFAARGLSLITRDDT
jgi:ATP-dependent DNA ligase